jgi:Mlc titration factor MtfA (ptsG expression regulator)
MSSSIVYLIIGSAIGLYLGIHKLRNGSLSFKREPIRSFPNQWRKLLIDHVEFYNRLSQAKKTNFEKRVHIFLLNVEIVGVGTDVTHLDRILVASGAVIPIFGFENWHYSNLEQVQIYPDKFLIPKSDKMASGLVGWGAMEGKMMLSRKALVHGFYDQSDQKNVAIHEFIHILDKQDGKIDGVLDRVMNEIDIKPWLHIINHKMNEIGVGESTIRKYGAANQAEFLAVVSEFFFESPEKMKTEHPALYMALDSFFNSKNLSANSSRNKYTSRLSYNRGGSGYNKG